KYSVPRLKKYSREGELFTAHRADFLRELRLSCTDAAALFSQSEGIFRVASEIAPALPCSIRETLLSIPSLMPPCRKEMRACRTRAYFRYLQAIRGGLQGHYAPRTGRITSHAWLRGKISWQFTMLKMYGLAYRVGIHLNFGHRTAALGQLVSL